MVEILGFRSMTKKKGKVVFIARPSHGTVGREVDKFFLFDDLSDKVNESHVGKECTLLYDRGYNGNAIVVDIQFPK